MTIPLKTQDKVATLTTTVSVSGRPYRVTVAVEAVTGETINQADATIALTKAMSDFPQRSRSGGLEQR